MKLKSIRPNFHRLCAPRVDVYFSYETPIAFQAPGQSMVIRENEWGPTTGKHLNYLSTDKKSRISGVVFNILLEQAAV